MKKIFAKKELILYSIIALITIVKFVLPKIFPNYIDFFIILYKCLAGLVVCIIIPMVIDSFNDMFKIK